MAVYIYKAMTKSGMIVRNRVESPTKQNLVKILKNNGMLPISIDKMPYGQKKQKVKKKKNVADMNEFMKNINTTEIVKENEPSTKEKIRMYFARSKKITPRDLVVFTQNFYLLKKANFNNIHALRTIISSTENFLFVILKIPGCEHLPIIVIVPFKGIIFPINHLPPRPLSSSF